MRLHLRGRAARFIARPPARTPIAPTLTVSASSDTSISVAWVFNDVQDADQIEIERSTVSGSGFANIATENVGSSPYSDTGRTAATTYYYRARAKINSGALTPYSSYSAEVSATTTGAATPTQPANLTATETSRSNTTVTYTLACDAVSGATSYDWYVGPSTDGGYENADATTPNNVVSATFSVTGVVFTRSSGNNEASPNVRARNASGPGPWKSTPVVVPGNLKAPVLNSAVASGTSVIITYTEDSEADAADEYEIERSDDGTVYAVVATKTAHISAPQFTDTGLASDTYFYRVRGHDTALDAYSSYSAIKSVTVGGAPPTDYDNGMDFSAMNSLADLSGSGFTVTHPNNVLFDDGTLVLAHTGQVSGIRGLMHRYAAEPLVCTDQFAVVTWNLAGMYEFWLEDTIVLSTNWTTVNPNCSSPAPDYKTILFDFQPTSQVGPGRPRVDWKIGKGGNSLAFDGSGFPSPGIAPPNGVVSKSTPIGALSLSDGLPHVYRLHYKWELLNGVTPVETCQSMVDGQVIHSYKDFAATIGTATIKRIRLSVNRNTRAHEEMYVHRLSTYLWRAGNDPGWFSGVSIDDYTD